MNIEEMASRYVAVKEIEKLMGRHTFLHLQLKNREEISSLWCKRAPEPTLTTNQGTYRGYEEIFSWYVEEFEKSSRENDAAMQGHYALLQQFDLSDIHGVGTFFVDTITTPIIEIAEDMQTAKGWFCGAAITTDTAGGSPQARWTWRKYGADFVCENGIWKIWHLTMLTEFSIRPGGNWVNGSDPLPSGSLPENPGRTYPYYSVERLPENQPPVPLPYATFSETFSY